MIYNWEECDLRSWLNDDFLNKALSKSEQKNIVETKVKNEDNQEYGTKGGEDTKDQIFCLSIGEVKKYFKQSDMQDSKFRIATKGTKYAKGIDNYGASLYVDNGDEWYKGNSPFCLRSPGHNQYYAADVYYDGHLRVGGLNVGTHISGVRVALWVNY